jgi:hypothetical protein
LGCQSGPYFSYLFRRSKGTGGHSWYKHQCSSGSFLIPWGPKSIFLWQGRLLTRFVPGDELNDSQFCPRLINQILADTDHKCMAQCSGKLVSFPSLVNPGGSQVVWLSVSLFVLSAAEIWGKSWSF